MPKARSGKAKKLDVLIQNVLGRMIHDGEAISARSVAKLVNVAVTSITRDAIRSAMVQAAIIELHSSEKWQLRQGKTSREELVRLLSDRDKKIVELELALSNLIASHKAMILSVGEQGGTQAWRKFYSNWRNIVDESAGEEKEKGK